MKKIIFVLAVFGGMLFLFSGASAAYLSISSSRPQQGDAVAVLFSGGSPKVQSADFDGQPVSFSKYKNDYVAVFGIPAAKKPGRYLLVINFAGGEIFRKQITVAARKFPEVVLGIPKKLGVTPKRLVYDLNIQDTKLNTVFSSGPGNFYFNEPFGLPLSNNRNIGSRFGEIRKTGREMIRHLGVDFSAKIGDAVAAINDGIIKEAYTDPIYGNSVIIDHGGGIFSAYFHLSKIIAKKGSKVFKGTIIGLVGQTGYATGPHLHLSVKINGVSVDPLRFVSIFK
ncbi:MAG: M23 family metallopeptidase [Patescibacteria group bacterium]|nr:M23 family metallopeptidase [Patescibacteria group bacterium]